jgi:hypothetical protein
MIRRGGASNWGTRTGGLYGSRRRRGGNARPLILGAIVVTLVVIGAWLVFRACRGSSCDTAYCPTGQDFATPAGYERVSDVFEWRASEKPLDAAQELQVAVPLNSATDDGRNLSFFHYEPATKAWIPLAQAVLDAGGASVSATFSSTPDIIAVFRRQSAAGHVIAYLPHNGVLHPEAADKVTIIHTRDFRPASDGGVLGEVTKLETTRVAEGASVALYPSIVVDAADRGAIPILTAILASSASRSTHVAQIVKKVTDLNLPGIDVAYFDLPPDQRTPFALFIAELGQALHNAQKVLTVSLPPPIRVADRIDEGAYDWAEIGRAADIVQIGVYRDQSTFRRDMPEILRHIVQQVSPGKLALTVSPFATEKSSDGSVRALTLTDAMLIGTKLSIIAGPDGKLTTNSAVDVVAVNLDRAQGRSGIVWDAQVAAVAFTYEQNGGRTIWIENQFSVGFKLEFIQRYGLAGVAIEDGTNGLGTIANLWPALAPFIASGQPLLLQPNGKDLEPRWEVSKGSGEGGQKGTLRWSTPPEPGTYTVKLTVSDGITTFQNQIPVSVQAKER